MFPRCVSYSSPPFLSVPLSLSLTHTHTHTAILTLFEAIKKRVILLQTSDIVPSFSEYKTPEMYIWEYASWRWLKCTHTGVTVRFFSETSLPFCFILSWSKSFLIYQIFRLPMQFSWTHVLPMCFPWTRSCLAFRQRNLCSGTSAQEYQRTFYFRKQVHISLCHLHNLCGTPLDHRPIYFRKHVYILLFHPFNLCCLSKKCSCRDLTTVLRSNLPSAFSQQMLESLFLVGERVSCFLGVMAPFRTHLA